VAFAFLRVAMIRSPWAAIFLRREIHYASRAEEATPARGIIPVSGA
jgi:hypothetical protein